MLCKPFLPEFCKGGCVCPPKYLRNAKGICVPQKECPEASCKANEVYEACPPKCPYRTCGIDDTLIDCPREPLDKPPCEPKCRCKPQFFRDDKGNCVPWEQCPTCTNPNEVYDPCFTPCGTDRCDFDPTVVKCDFRPPSIGDARCVAGCRCTDGFKRNNENVCVPQEDCPCKGDPNAKSGCGGFCTRCSNYKNGPIACKMSCVFGACDCREGYIYDDITKKCVLPEDCSEETTEEPSCDEDQRK